MGTVPTHVFMEQIATRCLLQTQLDDLKEFMRDTNDTDVQMMVCDIPQKMRYCSGVHMETWFFVLLKDSRLLVPIAQDSDFFGPHIDCH